MCKYLLSSFVHLAADMHPAALYYLARHYYVLFQHRHNYRRPSGQLKHVRVLCFWLVHSL